MAVFARMAIAVILGALVIYWKRIPFPWHRTAVKLYAYSAMGIFVGMLFVYLAANYIASGTISLIFGMAPILSGLMASRILGEAKFTLIQSVSLAISLLGLGIVFSDGLSLAGENWPGYVFILISVSFFCLSAVMVKSVTLAINPIATTQGALLLTLPFFFFAWLIMDGELPYEDWTSRSIYAIAYLGIFGSFLGFIAYYYILQHLPAKTVALITLMTPVIAMGIGAIFNDETISWNLALGASCVMIGLLLYQFGNRIFNLTNKAQLKPNTVED